MSLPEVVGPLNHDGLGDQIYERLRLAILTGRHRPGERVNPRALASHLGASITPVRDALHRLETDGLVEVAPRRGVFITRVTHEMIRETFEIRSLFEVGSADHIESVTDDTVERLTAIVDLMEALRQGNTYTDYARYLDLDRDFHTELILLYRNRRLLALYRNLRWTVQLAIVLTKSGDRRAVPTMAEHRAIVSAVADRDPIALRGAITLHLANALSDLGRRLPER